MKLRAPVALALIAVMNTIGWASPAGPNDPHFAKQWALQKIQAEQAWARSTGSAVIVAVIDTGIDLSHEDLATKLVPGVTIPRCNMPSCMNGRDDHGHGTHVAGIIAASTGNGIGIAGVAPSAQLMPVKVLDSEGSGTTSDVAWGIRYAVDHGARVLNLSLGVLTPAGLVLNIVGAFDEVHAAMEYAWAKGAVIVVAAGNDSFPACAEPAAYPKAICVGATDNRDLMATYSNSGHQLDVVAPGGAGSVFCEDWRNDIFSTIWSGSRYDCQGSAANDPSRIFATGYETLAGTSMATPHVAGVAALLAALGLTNQQISDAITRTSDDLGPPGYDPVFGHGRVNACRAVAGSC